MADLKEKLTRVIGRIEKKLVEIAALPAYAHVRPLPGPPSTDAQIQAYEQYLGLRLPPSYRTLLSLHDGYDWLMYPGHMLSIRDLMPGGAWHDRVLEWKRVSARYGAGEVLEGIPVANMGQPNSWVYLDPGRTDKRGEFAVVEWEPEDSEDYPDMLAYLEECLDTIQYGIDEAAGNVSTDD